MYAQNTLAHQGCSASEEIAQNHLRGDLCNMSRVAYISFGNFVNARHVSISIYPAPEYV